MFLTKFPKVTLNLKIFAIWQKYLSWSRMRTHEMYHFIRVLACATRGQFISLSRSVITLHLFPLAWKQTFAFRKIYNTELIRTLIRKDILLFLSGASFKGDLRRNRIWQVLVHWNCYSVQNTMKRVRVPCKQKKFLLFR